MAQADQHTSNTPIKPASSNWLLIVEDVFPQWRDRLGSSEGAKDKLEALLSDGETRSAKHRVDASGKEIPGTNRNTDAEFWPDRLLLVPDADGGVDHLAVDYSDYEDIYWDHYSPGWRWVFYVRQIDVERWERLHPELAAPPPKTTAGAEAQAIEHLKPLLEHRKDAMTKGEAWEVCKNRFSISEAGFENHVWPTARERAGLERKAPAGRKRRKPTEIKPEVEQIIGPGPDKKPRSKSPRKSRRKSRS